MGPVAKIVAAAPYSGLGFIEAHGLAFLIGIQMWRAKPSRAWHLTAVAIHVLLGTCNLVFWQFFIAIGHAGRRLCDDGAARAVRGAAIDSREHHRRPDNRNCPGLNEIISYPFERLRSWT